MSTVMLYQFIDLTFMPSLPLIGGIVIALIIILYLVITIRDYLP